MAGRSAASGPLPCDVSAGCPRPPPGAGQPAPGVSARLGPQLGQEEWARAGGSAEAPGGPARPRAAGEEGAGGSGSLPPGPVASGHPALPTPRGPCGAGGGGPGLTARSSGNGAALERKPGTPAGPQPRAREPRSSPAPGRRPAPRAASYPAAAGVRGGGGRGLCARRARVQAAPRGRRGACRDGAPGARRCPAGSVVRRRPLPPGAARPRGPRGTAFLAGSAARPQRRSLDADLAVSPLGQS